MTERCWARYPMKFVGGLAALDVPWVHCSNTGERYEKRFSGKHLYACIEHAPSSPGWGRSDVPQSEWKQLLTGQEP